MSDKILDEDVAYARFKKPVTLLVNKESWIAVCDELRTKAAIGTFIFVGLSAVVSIFTFGILVFIASLGVGVFINIGLRRKFAQLKSLVDHRYTISNDQIIDEFEGVKQILLFSKIKDIEFHNWGVELDIKTNRKMSDKSPNEGRIMIPREVNDYGRVVATFEYLKKK